MKLKKPSWQTCPIISVFVLKRFHPGRISFPPHEPEQSQMKQDLRLNSNRSLAVKMPDKFVFLPEFSKK